MQLVVVEPRWSIPYRYRPVWLDLVGSGLDLDEILLDLVRFQVIFRRRTPNTVGFCKFSSKNLRISSEDFSLMIGLGGSGFWEETHQPTWRCWVLWAATHHWLFEWSVWVWASWSGFWVGWTILNTSLYTIFLVYPYSCLSLFFIKIFSLSCNWSWLNQGGRYRTGTGQYD